MKEYKIHTSGLQDFQKQLNLFFEKHPSSDIMTITPSRCLVDNDFARGTLKKQVIVSVHYS